MLKTIHVCAVALSLGLTAQLSFSADPSPPATPPAPATEPAPADSATPAAPAEDEEAKLNHAFEQEAKNYRQVEKDGQKLYCRSEKTLGSRLPKPVCLNEGQLWERVRKAQAMRDDMRQGKPGACGSGNMAC